MLVYHDEAMAEAADVPPFMQKGNVQDQPLAHGEVQDHSSERVTEEWAEEPGDVRCETKAAVTGHVARMKEHRLPRKLLTVCCYNKQPKGGSEFTYGEGLEFALSYAKVDRGLWMVQAQEKETGSPCSRR